MSTQEQLLQALFRISRKPRSRKKLTRASKRLTAALLAFGSESPDNLNLGKQVDYGWAKHPLDRSTRLLGFRLKRGKTLVSDVLYESEDALGDSCGSGIPSSRRRSARLRS